MRGRKGIPKADDSEIVIGVVVVSARLAGEAHARKGAELGRNVGFEEDMEIDEVGGNGETEHLKTLEKDGLAMLGLVKRGVIIGERSLRMKLGLTERRKLSGRGGTMNVKR